LQLYIDTGTHHDQVFGHPFAGYFLPYPESTASGLVSSISDDPPVMNWIYVDRWSYELKFGNRVLADDNWPAPWDCSRQDRRLTFGSWEGFLAVKEGNFWALYFDIDEDHLRAKVAKGTPVLEVVLLRVEVRVPKPQKPPEQEKEEEGVKKENSEKQQKDNATADAAAAANNASGQQQHYSDQQDNIKANGYGSAYHNGAPITPPPEEPLESLPVD
jgi:hypothetical protein